MLFDPHTVANSVCRQNYSGSRKPGRPENTISGSQHQVIPGSDSAAQLECHKSNRSHIFADETEEETLDNGDELVQPFRQRGYFVV
jgi:hypothetical protein